MSERVELQAVLSDDSRTVRLEMLVGGRSVGAVVVLRPEDVDYHINAMSRLREGMVVDRKP